MGGIILLIDPVDINRSKQMRYILLLVVLLISFSAKSQSFSDYEYYIRQQSKVNKMVIETKYSPGDYVFIIIGSGDNAKVYESQIASVTTVTAMSGTAVTYSCSVDKTKIGTALPGMPTIIHVEKKEQNMFDTAEDCFKAITIINEQNKKKNGNNNH